MTALTSPPPSTCHPATTPPPTGPCPPSCGPIPGSSNQRCVWGGLSLCECGLAMWLGWWVGGWMGGWGGGWLSQKCKGCWGCAIRSWQIVQLIFVSASTPPSIHYSPQQEAAGQMRRSPHQFSAIGSQSPVSGCGWLGWDSGFGPCVGVWLLI